MLSAQSCKTHQVSIGRMRCEYQQTPIAVDTEHPRFSWTYSGDTAWHQATYIVFLSDNPHNLEGKLTLKPGVGAMLAVQTSQPTAVYFGHIPLRAHTTYYWRVKATDGKRSVESPIASFETAKMSQKDWTAQWISDGRPREEHCAPLLRKVFHVSDGLQKSRLYVSAAAYAKIEINGERVGTSSLNPGYTHYDRRNLYNVYDIAPMLHEGENVITAVLGNGFYNEIDRLGVWDFDRASWHGRPRMLCEILLHYADSVENIKSDATWQTTDSPYLVNDIYSGDTYDARLAPTGAERPDYEASTWRQCVVVDAPSPLVQAQQMGLTATDTIYRPASMHSIGDSIYVVDFGTNMSGYARLRLRGRAGTVLRVQHGEELDAEGRVNVDRITGLFDKGKGFGFQTDVYTLSGHEDVLSPEFTYHGFRYAEIHVSPAMHIGADNVEALFVHTSMRPVGHFRCSNDTLNRIWQAVNQSYLSNFMSIPTDCPQREKNGWTADAHISSDIGLLNFDAFTAYEKWLCDMEDNQRPDGQIADIIPSSGWGYGVNPVWSAAMYIIPMNLYYYTGDLKAIRQALPLCQKYLQFLASHESETGSIASGLGDWVPYKTSTPEEFTSTCYYYLLNDYTAQFCRLTGTDGSEYAKKAERIRQLINTRFYDEATGLYSNGSQAAQAVPLFLGIVPEARRQAVADRLSRLIADNGNYLDFGMLGSKAVLRVLTQYGHIDQAVDMALQKEAPSWAAWIADGHTTPPEEWIPKGGSSLNHVFLGDINAWMYNALAGINYDPACPGFRHILLTPHFPRRLAWAEASYESFSGLIRSRWERQGERIVLHIEIPVNTTATLRLDGKETQLGAGRHTITCQDSSAPD
ncbi:MAG: glycoside hydrolase family 78 protein [Bacteroidaceae bacterium]|nr:glycoside hydrolase family 78 protein [Bacteroidaceae bacterium]